MSGKILIQWRHSLCAEIARTRYTNPESTRAVHTEIANIFFNPDAGEDSSDDTSSERSTTKSGMCRFFCECIIIYGPGDYMRCWMGM